MKKTAVILILVLSLAAFMALKLQLDSIPRTEVPGASILYIPSGRALQYMAFGNTSFLADMIYLWAIQYFSNTAVAERYDHLEHVFSIIADLDPKYLDPYQIGAMIAYPEAGDMTAAFRILDLGLEKNPDQWIFPWQAGHMAQINLKDFRLAQAYYKKAMEIEGAPDMTRRLYANAATELSDYETAGQLWLEIYKTTLDPRVKKIAFNHLYRVNAAQDLEVLNQAVQAYKQDFGRFPENLSKLVTSGLMASIPRDLENKDYLYDSQTGEVTSAPWWKR
jgi:tetratricopeptide (TPR) repeat protein